MRTRSIAVALMLALTPALGVPLPAYAQPTDDATTQEVRARFHEGVDLFDKGQFEAARAKFKQAYALKPLPDILYNLAWSALKSGHPVEAEREFVRFLHDARDIEPAKQMEANKGLAESRAKNGHIEVAAASGADVFVDGEKVGTTPLGESVPVEPGAHVVRVAPNDAAPQSQSVSVLAGQTQTARFGAATAPAPVPSPPGSSTAEPPASPPPVDATQSAPPAAEAPDSSSTATPPTPPSESQPKVRHSIWPENKVPLVIGGVVTVAGFATGLAMLIAKGTAQNNANSVANQIIQHGGTSHTCGPPAQKGFETACSTLADDNNTVNTDATIGNVGLVVGIVGGVGTVLYWVLAPKEKAETATTTAVTRPWVAPILAPGTGGVSVGGAF